MNSGVLKQWRGSVWAYTEDTDWVLLLTTVFMAFDENSARVEALFYGFNHCTRTGFGPKTLNIVVEEIGK